MARAKGADRLNSVIRIAEDAERKAFSELARCREEMQAQEVKLDDLVHYRSEYHQGMRETGATLQPQQIQNRFQFLQTLERAISGQRDQIAAWKDQESRLQKVWLEKRVRCRALNKATEKRQEQVRHQSVLREQKQVDDLVSSRFKRS